MTQTNTLPAAERSAAATASADLLKPSDTFPRRHLGPRDTDIAEMLATLGVESLDALADSTVPRAIRRQKPLELPGLTGALTESQAIARLRTLAERNQVFTSCIGMGYYDCITPAVIQRNILENPGWYTQYTPYQAEISQGRLEALLNFQTMVADLTGLPLANASLLDEATAAAEAMAMCHRIAPSPGKRDVFFVADDCHPQTINVCRTRATPLGIELRVGPIDELESIDAASLCGALVQYPATDGRVHDPDKLGAIAKRLHEGKSLLVVATDLLALCLLKPPGEFDADIAVGSAQRFGVPMGYGGPHAAFMATHEKHARKLPGRIVGVSKDADGNPAYRLAIQTREQHIKRDRATSNICTAQVLLAIMASMYAVYHGPNGLRRIARRVHAFTRILAEGLRRIGHSVEDGPAFDTLRVRIGSGGTADAEWVIARARQHQINLRDFGDGSVGVSLDETTTAQTVNALFEVFAGQSGTQPTVEDVLRDADGLDVPAGFARTSDYLTHEVFNSYHAEHELLRYIKRLESRDLSLTTSMIPLGSCTMKLNATSEMLPVTWPQFGRLHPYAPREQAKGYAELFKDLENWLAAITGLPAVSLQPNAGSQGEYAGLLAIRGYHASRAKAGDTERDACLIPVSAHGTNPASAVLAGFRVVPVACDPQGNIDIDDLKAKAAEHTDRLGALMITYPSTHGVFEAEVRDICATIHEHGGQVYLDGANMNAMVGLSDLATIGADVCHINLHKTFCIPHGGGGPGMGPICAAEHLRPFLPGDPLAERAKGEGPGAKGSETSHMAVGPVSAAPYGSPSILVIPWMYIAMMGGAGLTKATQVAILNANYMAKRIEGHYPVLFTGKNGRVAHEFVVDCRQFRVGAAVEVEDIAKRLMDYGFHAPTMSWPVPGTLMIEPTESESKEELDRLCDALIAIRAEVAAIERAEADIENNVLKHAPHPASRVSANHWPHPYPREQAAYPAPWLKEHKFWPPVSRIDNPYGDRHLICTCPTVEAAAAT